MKGLTYEQIHLSTILPTVHWKWNLCEKSDVYCITFRSYCNTYQCIFKNDPFHFQVLSHYLLRIWQDLFFCI